MSNQESKRRKFQILPDSIGLGIAFLIGLLGEALFILFVLALDVLPFKYILIILAAFLLVDIGVVLLLNTKKKRSVKRILGLIVIVLMLNILIMGDFYVYSTYDTLQKISKYRATWEIYDVVTLKDGSYPTIDSIKGQTVTVMDRDSKQQNEAAERLVTKADVTINKEATITDVGAKIYNEAGQTANNIILVTREDYALLDKHISGFKDNTQVIYKIKVKKRKNDSTKTVDVTEDSFNVLISGKDVWGKLKSDKKGLSDVDMVMTVNPKTKEILLTSIPRDSNLVLHSYGARDKLTHTGIYGEAETKATIEDFLGIDINYGITVNFSMLVNIIDAIDGIDVYSDYDFTSAIHDCTYHKGMNHLNGTEALYFARERKAFTDGDMQRNKHQQVVMKATIEKVTSSKVILMRYTELLEAVEDQMYTDLSDKDLKAMAKMTIKDMNHTWTVNTVNVSGPTGSAPCYSMGNQMLSCVFPSEETTEAAKKAIHDTMYPVDNTKQKNQPKSDAKSKDKKSEESSSDSGSSDSSSEE